MKNKCVKNIWMIVLLLLIYPINVKATESECTHDFETVKVIKESTYKEYGEKLQSCRVCGIREVHKIPKDIARIPDVVGDFGIYISAYNTTYKTDITKYDQGIARGDYIKSVKVVSNKDCMKVVSHTKTTFTVKTTNKSGLAKFEIKLASGKRAVYSVNVGKDYTNASSIREITTSKKKTASNSFYEQIRTYAKKVKGNIYTLPRGYYTLEFCAINDKNCEYYATRRHDKNNKKIIISFNEAQYKKLKNFQVDKHLGVENMYGRAASLTDENYEGPFLTHDIKVISGDAYDNYADPVFEEQRKYIQSLIDNSTYDKKWKLSGLEVFLVNKEGIEDDYQLLCNGKKYLRTVYLYIDIYNFDMNSFTQKKMDKILSDTWKLAEETNMALDSRAYKR